MLLENVLTFLPSGRLKGRTIQMDNGRITALTLPGPDAGGAGQARPAPALWTCTSTVRPGPTAPTARRRGWTPSPGFWSAGGHLLPGHDADAARRAAGGGVRRPGPLRRPAQPRRPVPGHPSGGAVIPTRRCAAPSGRTRWPCRTRGCSSGCGRGRARPSASCRWRPSCPGRTSLIERAAPRTTVSLAHTTAGYECACRAYRQGRQPRHPSLQRHAAAAPPKARRHRRGLRPRAAGGADLRRGSMYRPRCCAWPSPCSGPGASAASATPCAPAAWPTGTTPWAGCPSPSGRGRPGWQTAPWPALPPICTPAFANCLTAASRRSRPSPAAAPPPPGPSAWPGRSAPWPRECRPMCC